MQRIDKIVRSPGGTKERVERLADVQVPDCWHAAMHLAKVGNERGSEIVLETWHLCHDLLRHLKKLADEESADVLQLPEGE